MTEIRNINKSEFISLLMSNVLDAVENSAASEVVDVCKTENPEKKDCILISFATSLAASAVYELIKYYVNKYRNAHRIYEVEDEVIEIAGKKYLLKEIR